MSNRFTAKLRRMLSMLLVLAMVLSMVSPVTASATAYTAGYSDSMQLQVGEQIQLKAPLWYFKTTWSSSDETVATVSQMGILTGVKAGEAVITAKSGKLLGFIGLERTTTYHVTVTEVPEKVELHVGDTTQLTVEDNGGKVLWSSSNPRVAKVSSNGTVTAMREGEATVTAKIMERSAWNWLRWYQTLEVKFQIIVTPVPTEPEVPTEPPVITYTVTFESNGGSAVEAQIVEEGMTAIEPEAPALEGYAFAGWYSDQELTIVYDFSSVITADITLYADWDEVFTDEETDTDTDEVPDYIEELFGTNTNSDDTDGDGVSDYIEIFKISSDPNVYDTDSDGTLDGDEDPDNDGLSNIEEIEIGTDLTKADSDSDGLTDYDEFNHYQTDPLIYDTDADGVSDGYEIQIGTDPLVADGSFEITKTEGNTDDNITASVDIELSGEQVDTLNIEAVDNDILFPEYMPGYIGSAYNFNVDGEFETAIISFEFDSAQLNENAEPTIFYFNEETQTLEELETTITENVASATVEHFSTYILLDRIVYYGSLTWEDVWDNSETFSSVEIVLVIDDSGSMDSNDSSNQRLTVAQNLIDKLPEGSQIGIVWFASSAKLLTSELTTDKEAAKAYLTTDYFKSSGGTYMYTAINNGFTLFESTEDDVLKMMVVLSDGNSSGTSNHSSTIATAQKNDIRIYTVGLGSSTSYFTNYLKPLAEETGGSFYLASEADELGEIYENINKQIDLDTDTDHDGIPDYYEDNMIAFNGVKIELDKTKADTDGDGLADNEEVSVELIKSDDGTKVYVKGILLSHPSLADSDYDGKIDPEDEVPTSNWFGGKLSTDYATSSVSTFMDYRWFFGDNTVYNNKLSKLSLLFSSVIYSGNSLSLRDSLSKQKTDGKTLEQVMAYFGMNNPQTFSLNSYYSDEHLSEVGLGYHNVVVDGELRTVLAVTVRGTNSTIEEWTSNFDVGDTSTNTETDDWKNTENHKGFDIAANRIMELVEQYILDNDIDKDVLVYWVTGHSRGAAIANIIGANLEDAGRTAFTYTFATPNTTIASNAGSYNTIFNIVNEDDFVPCLPIDAWGYTRYGSSTTSVSIRRSYENKWEETTGIKDYNSDTFNMQSCVNAIGAILSSDEDARVALYTYTCDCSYSDHKGDCSNDTVTITNEGLTANSRKKAIAKIPENAKPYCYIREYDGGGIGGYDFDVCQTPAYFMQLIAAIMGKEISAYRFAVELNIARRYETAKGAIIAAYLSGIEHPHFTESYYVIADNITETAFS